MRATLRPLRESDLDVLSRRENDGATSPFDDFGFEGAGALRRRFAEDGCLPKAGDRGRLAIVVDGEKLVGTVGWNPVMYGPNEGSRAFNLGMVLLPEQRNHGFGPEALRLITRYLFDHTQVGRLEGSTDVENLHMQHVVERVGFAREGILRGAQYRLGRRHDLVMYSLLRTDIEPSG